MRNPEEKWQVDVNGEIYDTTFGELSEWISESSLLEGDKVRRGNLRWLEAGKVPALVPFFNAKERGELPNEASVTTTVADVGAEPGEPENSSSGAGLHGVWSNEGSAPEETGTPDGPAREGSPSQDTPVQTDYCSIHDDVPARYLCRACAHPFCDECPEGFGATVRICPYCGGMCDEKEAMQKRQHRENRIRADIDAGFGFDDFGRAMVLPFRYKTSLFFGGLLFALFGIGQSAASMGSIFLIAAALICFMMANALTFGVLANTVDKFSQGIIDRNFMPSFDDFSLWDDVVHPFFLSIGVYISSFGLLIVLVVGAVWYAWNSLTGMMANQAGPPVATMAGDSQQTADKIKELISKARAQNAGRSGIKVGPDGLTERQRSTLEEEAEFQRLNDLATNYRKGQLEAVVGKNPETKEKEFRQMVSGLLKFAGVFILLAGVALLWGVFYFPAACAVAGYTRSFVATLNPLVGLDTIRHLGLDYLKILGMLILIGIMSAVANAVLGIIFSPFDMPVFGNIPAKFLGSFVTFYFWIVLSVILGYALYKNSEKLKLARD